MKLAYFDWQPPSALAALVELDRERLGEQWKRRAGREFREAFIAARFAEFRNATEVRLIPPNGREPTPDFAVRLAGGESWFEATEIDRPGRRRSAELPLTGPTQVSPDEWVSTCDYLKVLESRSAAKAKKPYVKCDGLVIYDNAWPLKDPENQTVEWWRSGTVEAREHFAEVWSFDGKSFALIAD